MTGIWEWLKDDRNRSALQLIVTIVTAVAGGSWTLYNFVLKDNPVGPVAFAEKQDYPRQDAALPLADALWDHMHARATLVSRAGDILYLEDEHGAYSLDQGEFLRDNRIHATVELHQFNETAESDLRQCSESAAQRPGLDEKVAARANCLENKGYSANSLRYIRARYGIDL